MLKIITFVLINILSLSDLQAAKVVEIIVREEIYTVAKAAEVCQKKCSEIGGWLTYSEPGDDRDNSPALCKCVKNQ